jgi:hypothetical protein
MHVEIRSNGASEINFMVQFPPKEKKMRLYFHPTARLGVLYVSLWRNTTGSLCPPAGERVP